VADLLEHDLSRFLHRAAARRFRLGRHDCGLWLADWVLEVRGIDPAAPVRGRYDDERSLERLLPPGGLPRLFDRLFREAGLIRTIQPAIGDVAIIAVHRGPPTGAIRTARGYVMLAERRGVCSVPANRMRLIAAWKV
jgi:hypothetical protein